MRERFLTAELLIPHHIEEVFAFFEDPRNLDRLTPPWLRFKILTSGPLRMAAGVRLDYALRIRGLPFRWTSEITEWEPPHRFVDEQRSGPYRRWVHRHLFEACDDGTWMRDEVTYAVPGGMLEPLVNSLVVGRDLRRVFSYRLERIAELFPGCTNARVVCQPGARAGAA